MSFFIFRNFYLLGSKKYGSFFVCFIFKTKYIDSRIKEKISQPGKKTSQNFSIFLIIQWRFEQKNRLNLFSFLVLMENQFQFQNQEFFSPLSKLVEFINWICKKLAKFGVFFKMIFCDFQSYERFLKPKMCRNEAIQILLQFFKLIKKHFWFLKLIW